MSKKGIWRVVAMLCLVVVVAVACGCASSKKPKPVNPYKGVMSDRGSVPPAYAEPSKRPQSLKAAPAPADVPAPTDNFDGEGTIVPAPEEDVAFADEEGPADIQDAADAVAPAPAAPQGQPAAAHRQNFPVVANGKVPSADLVGKGGAPSAGKSASAATAGGTYVVKSGDILGRIASAHNAKVSDIVALNPGINPNKLIVGQTLVMPAGAANLDGAAASSGKTGGTAAAATAKSGAKKGREPIPADGLYTVAANDSLWKIGDRFGVAVSDIRTWNGLTSDRLKIGQQLKLRGEGGAAAPAATPATNVAPPKTDAPVEPVKDDGPVVVVENAGAGAAAAPAEPPAEEVRTMEYFVCEGDTIDSICNAIEILREDFLQANPSIRSDADLKVGMPVRIVIH